LTNAEDSKRNLVKSIFFGFYLFLICFFLANLEIQIEGPNGWAAKLPTWRVTDPNWTWIFGGRPITGYHVFLNLLLLSFFHFPLLFTKFSLVKEMKIIYSYSIISVVWDFQWFAMNPHFGIKKYLPENIWWFKNWLLGFPVDYFAGIAISCMIFIIPTFFKKVKLKAMFMDWLTITSTLIILTAIIVLFY
jgi:hypothetical protein